jgi:hypothetical protein
MDPSSLASQLASHGILGIIVVILGWAYWRKDQELKTERDAHLADTKAFADQAIKLEAQVLDAVNKLAELEGRKSAVHLAEANAPAAADSSGVEGSALPPPLPR